MQSGGGMAAARALLRDRRGAGAIATALMFGVVLLFPQRMPTGVYLDALVFGVWAGLASLGAVLVFRASRVINFAALQFGATPGLLFYEVVHKHAIAKLLAFNLHGEHQPGWALTAEYWIAAVLAVIVAGLLGALCYLVVIRPLASAPPLVGTVATMAVSALLAALTAYAIKHWFHETTIPAGTVPPPHDVSVAVSGVQFDIGALVSFGCLLLVLPLVEIYLRRSRLGTGVRAAADNRERAATLGVNPTIVSAVVWALAGILAGIAAVLTVIVSGPAGLADAGNVIPVLVALVIAGMVGLRIGFLAGVGTGVLSGGLLWSFGQSAIVVPILLAIAVAVLLLRRPSASRVGEDEVAWQAAREVRPVPPELRGLPDVRRLRIRTAVLVAAVVILFPFISPAGTIGAWTTFALDAMVGLSLLVLTGWAGLISLGQFAFAAVGAWVVGVLAGAHHVSALVALPAAVVAGALTAFIVGLPALRIRGIYLAVVSFGFAATVATLLLGQQYAGSVLPAVIGRPSLFGLSTMDDRAFYFLVLAFLGLSVVAVTGLRRSRVGRALIASRENEKAAELFGVKLVSARLQAFGLSGAIAALAGALFAYQQGSIDVGNFTPGVSLVILLMVIVGGMGSLAGPLFGAVVVGVLTEFGTNVDAIGLPLLLIAVLLAIPGGITQVVFRLRDGLLRRIAYRNRIVVPSLVDATHPAWSLDQKIPLAEATVFVPERYALDHRPLSVPKVAATGRGA